jgi:hypothetical protein
MRGSLRTYASIVESSLRDRFPACASRTRISLSEFIISIFKKNVWRRNPSHSRGILPPCALHCCASLCASWDKYMRAVISRDFREFRRQWTGCGRRR